MCLTWFIGCKDNAWGGGLSRDGEVFFLRARGSQYIDMMILLYEPVARNTLT